MFSNNTNSSSLDSQDVVSTTSASASSSSPPPATASTSSWQALRTIGRQHYQNKQYDAAYYAFHHAYSKMKQQQQQHQQSNVSSEELQFMLSNIIACRLQIGGIIHLENAIVESKECIAINPTWSKAYIRLASSYMALRTYHSQLRGTGTSQNHINHYSNDICNALQTAIRYDPNHTTAAKQMLLQELRYRNQSQNGPNIDNNNNSTTGSSSSTTINPPPVNPDYIPPSTSLPNNHETRDINPPIPLEGFYDNIDHHPNENHHHQRRDGGNMNPEFPATNLQQQWLDWNEYGTRLLQSTIHNMNRSLQYFNQRYQSLPNNHRKALTFLFVLLLLLILYSNNHSYSKKRSRKMKGNYGSDNIYEQIRREKLQRQQRQYYGNNNNNDNNPYHHTPPDQRSYQQYNDHHHQQQQHHYHHGYSQSNMNYARTPSRSSSSLEMNGILYMLIIAVAVYIGHTYFGMNPWQIILLLRMVQNGGGGGGGGGFMWYNGGGGGFGRGRHQYRRRGFW